MKNIPRLLLAALLKVKTSPPLACYWSMVGSQPPLGNWIKEESKCKVWCLWSWVLQHRWKFLLIPGLNRDLWNVLTVNLKIICLHRNSYRTITLEGGVRGGSEGGGGGIIEAWEISSPIWKGGGELTIPLNFFFNGFLLIKESHYHQIKTQTIWFMSCHIK